MSFFSVRLAAVALSATVLATAVSAEEAKPVMGGTITIAWNVQPPSLDPIATASYATRDIAKTVFESLLQLDENYTPRPVLAKSFKVSDNNTKFTFELRTDVVFHNGAPMTTADVVASIQRWIGDSIVGKKFFDGATVAETAPGIVTITTPRPLTAGATLLADPQQILAIMPKSVIDRKTTTGVPEIVGTGPYVLTKWQTDQYVQLDKFAKYVSPTGPASGLAGEKKAYADRIVFQIVPDASTRLSGLQTAQYDVSYSMASDNLVQVKADPNLKAINEVGYFQAVVFNKKAGPGADINFRKAVQVALDLDSISIAAFGDPVFIELDGSISPVGSPGYNKAGFENYNRKDLALAKQFLAKSSYKGETLRYLTTRDWVGHYETAAEVQQQLGKLGIKIDLLVSDGATIFTRREDPKAWDLFTVGWSMASSPILYTVLQPSYPGWTNDPAIAQTIQAVNDAPDEAGVKAAYVKLQQAVYDYVPFVKTENYYQLMGARSNIDGIRQLAGPIVYGVYRTAK